MEALTLCFKEGNQGNVTSCASVLGRLLSMHASTGSHSMNSVKYALQIQTIMIIKLPSFFVFFFRAAACRRCKSLKEIHAHCASRMEGRGMPWHTPNWAGTLGQFGYGDTSDKGHSSVKFTKHHRLTLAILFIPISTSYREPQLPGCHSTVKPRTRLVPFWFPYGFKSTINKTKERELPDIGIRGGEALFVCSSFVRMLWTLVKWAEESRWC